MQTRRPHESFKGSNSSLASSSGELSQVIASYCSRQWETHAFSYFGGKMGFLGHNFGYRHARRSSKGSIDMGDHLVSKKSLSQNFCPLDWHPEPVKVGQKTQYPHFASLSQANPSPKSKYFFLTHWHPAGFGDFRQKKHLNVRGFAHEYLRSCSL